MMEIKGRTIRQKRLIQLETLLNYEIPVSGAFLVLIWMMPWQASVIVVGLILLAVLLGFILFILALLFLLFQLRKFGWLTTLLLFAILPLGFIHPLYHESVMYPAHYIAPLGFFVFHSLLLRVSMASWPD